MRPVFDQEHPALRELIDLCVEVQDEGLRRRLIGWRKEHIRCCGCESLIDKDAHGRLAAKKLREILKHQAKNRELELGRFAVEGAGITEQFDAGHAIGQHTRLWVLV